LHRGTVGTHTIAVKHGHDQFAFPPMRFSTHREHGALAEDRHQRTGCERIVIGGIIPENLSDQVGASGDDDASRSASKEVSIHSLGGLSFFDAEEAVSVGDVDTAVCGDRRRVDS